MRDPEENLKPEGLIRGLNAGFPGSGQLSFGIQRGSSGSLALAATFQPPAGNGFEGFQEARFRADTLAAEALRRNTYRWGPEDRPHTVPVPLALHFGKND